MSKTTNYTYYFWNNGLNELYGFRKKTCHYVFMSKKHVIMSRTTNYTSSRSAFTKRSD